MVGHCWGDEDFDWNALYESIRYCMKFWQRWGRIGSYGKEKYGTFRDHVFFWDGTLQRLIWPGYARIMGWKWFYWNIDYKLIRPLMLYSGLLRLWSYWQQIIYNYAIQKMCNKHPHIIDELVVDLDGYQYIKPGIFGKVDGEAIHNKYYNS